MNRSASFAATLIAAALVACALTAPASATEAPVVAPAAKAASKPAKKDSKPMSLAKKCPPGNLHRSRCMIELLLEDLAASYGGVGGGGISQIRAASSTSYTVSLPQEGRIDLITYDFEIAADGTVKLKGKTPGTENVEPPKK